jgi:hypothetical protein
MLSYKNFMRLDEGGNAIADARPFTQKEAAETYKWVVKTIYPLLKISDKIDAKPVGSFGKKTSDKTSGDIDIAIAADKLAGLNHISVDSVLDFVEEKIKSAGYDTTKSKGFNQISFSAPINGDFKNGTGQIDFMFTDSLDWSVFMYYSPDFTKAESKYKGLYRNILLMKIISNAKREITKTTDTGETEEYNSYVIRLNQGIVNVTKSYKGKRGLLKNPKLLRDQDKFITNTPKELVELFFSPNIQVKDIMTFEDLWAIFTGPDFIHKDKFDDILEEFVKQIKRTKVPIPTEVENDYPNFVSENAQSQSHYIKLFENFKGSN